MIPGRIIQAHVTIGLLLLVLAACNDSGSSVDPRTLVPLVRVASVESASQEKRSFSGVVAARVQSDLGFRVAGKIQERMVDAGQVVLRGQPLLRIDPTDLKLAMIAQDEAVAAAMARARQASDDEERYRELVSTGVVSASVYDTYKAVSNSMRAELKAAQARADIAHNDMDYAILYADADGVVVDTLGEPGQVVSVGQVVVRVAQAGAREAVIGLPERLRPAIGSAGRATLYGSGLTGLARLRQLSDAANPQTRTFEARYVLENELTNAPLGSTVSIEIHSSSSAPMLQVPLGAIFDPGKGPGVWLVDDSRGQGQPSQVTWRGVQVASLSVECAAIASGVAAGDRVVVLGAHLLHEGELVRLADGPSEATAGGEGR